MAAEGKGKGSQGARPPGPSCPINGRAVPLGSFYRESHSVALQSPPTQTPTCSGADLNGRSKHAALAQPAPPSTPHPPPPPGCAQYIFLDTGRRFVLAKGGPSHPRHPWMASAALVHSPWGGGGRRARARPLPTRCRRRTGGCAPPPSTGAGYRRQTVVPGRAGCCRCTAHPEGWRPDGRGASRLPVHDRRAHRPLPRVAGGAAATG